MDTISKLSEKEAFDKLKYYDRKYRIGESEISDEEFDLIILYLEEKYPDNEYWTNKPRKIELKPETIDLGSLKKYRKKDWSQMVNVIKGYDKLCLLPKYDGSSLLLVYDINGNFYRARTRLRSEIGEDMTNKAMHFVPTHINIPKIILQSMQKYRATYLFLHCEALMSMNIFNKYFKDKYKNRRSAVSALINSKLHDDAKYIDIVPFDLYWNFEERNTIDIFKYIHEMGFYKTPIKTISPNELNAEYLDEYINKLKSTTNKIEKPGSLEHVANNYMTDGVVIRPLHYAKEHIAIPTQMFAYKVNLSTMIKETEVINIEWNTGRTGNITPVVVYKEIVLNNANYNRVSGHNAAYLFRNNIFIGQKVEIILSGDVIPKILSTIGNTYIEERNNIISNIEYINDIKGIVYDDTTNILIINKDNKYNITNVNAQKYIKLFTFITKCPSCDNELTYSKTVGRYCANPICPSKKQLGIVYYLKGLGIKNIAEQQIEKLNIMDIDDLYNLSIKQMESIDGIGSTIANHIYNEIRKRIKAITVGQFINAMNIPSVAEKTANKIFAEIDIVDYLSDTYIDYTSYRIYGVSKNAMENLFDNRARIKLLYKILIQYGLTFKKEEKTDKLNNLKFVLTGKDDVNSKSRKDIEQLIRNNGGCTTSVVSSTVDYVITNDINSNTTKVKEAKNKKIKLMSYNEFYSIIIN